MMYQVVATAIKAGKVARIATPRNQMSVQNCNGRMKEDFPAPISLLRWRVGTPFRTPQIATTHQLLKFYQAF